MILSKMLPVRSIVTTVLVFSLFGIFALSCSSDSDESTPAIVYGIDDDALPSSSLVDWVSYASQVSVVTVVSEEELPVPEGLSGDRGGGYVGRKVNLRIDKTLWSPPGTAPQTGTISSVVNGWIRKNGVTVPYGSLGAERLEVGKTYIIPLVQYESGWGRLSASTVLPVGPDQRVVVDPERITQHDFTTTARQRPQ